MRRTISEAAIAAPAEYPIILNTADDLLITYSFLSE
jgi:hypothetical protein